MRPPRVVVHGTQGKHPAEMRLSVDQHPVRELGPDGQHEPFGEAVRPRTPGRGLDRLDTRIREHRIEEDRELPARSRTRNRNPPGAFTKIHHEIAGLPRPGPVGMSGHTQLAIINHRWASACAALWNRTRSLRSNLGGPEVSPCCSCAPAIAPGRR
jgi:hypothetical protein